MENSIISKSNNKENELKKSKKEFFKNKKAISSSNNNNTLNNNSLSEINNITPETPENNNNFSLLTNLNANKSILTDINKVNKYKHKISCLEQEIKKTKTEKNDFYEIKQKISNCQNQIKLYINKNNKQREQLQLLSHQIDQQLESINYNKVKKQILKNQLENNDDKTQKEIVDMNIESSQRQLENIMSLIEILEKENEKLKNKIKNINNTKKYYEIQDKQRVEKSKINELTNLIKMKKFQLKMHITKCNLVKLELLKKIEFIKDELNRNLGKNLDTKKKLDILEKKEKGKNEYKPKIIAIKNNSINFRNNSMHLKYNLKTENNIIDINKIKNKNIQYKNDGIINDNKNDKKNIVKMEKNDGLVVKKDSFNEIMKEGMINIPSNLIEIFTEKELKAIFIGLNRNKEKYKQLLKKFEVQNTLVDTLETRHKLELKNKLNKINELDEQIEFLNIKKFDIEADIQLYKDKISKEMEKRNICYMKVNEIFNQVEDKKKILDKKKREIKLLKYKLLNLKNLVKNGDIKSIKKDPEIYVEYLEKDEENNIINRIEENKNVENIDEENVNEENNIINNINVETPKTQRTAYEEEDENLFNNILIKNKNMDRLIPKEEHISLNNSISSSKIL